MRPYRVDPDVWFTLVKDLLLYLKKKAKIRKTKYYTQRNTAGELCSLTDRQAAGTVQ